MLTGMFTYVINVVENSYAGPSHLLKFTANRKETEKDRTVRKILCYFIYKLCINPVCIFLCGHQ